MSIIFVFGSNLAGRHGAGAAYYAKIHYGAMHGRGIGFQGQSWAIPTKGKKLETLPLDSIKKYVDMFLSDARNNEVNYLVTRIGCGLAGYRDEDMAPLFKGAPENCFFSARWSKYL